MKYFRINDSFNTRGRWYLGAPKDRDIEVDPRTFTEGKRYFGSRPLAIPVKHGNKPIDFTLASFDMPVATAEVGRLIHGMAERDIQLIPALVNGDDYQIINALAVLNALDEDRSEIIRWAAKDGGPQRIGTIFGIGKLVLRRRPIEKHHIFRVQKWELPLIVSEALKAELESKDVSGIVFEQIATD